MGNLFLRLRTNAGGAVRLFAVALPLLLIFFSTYSQPTAKQKKEQLQAQMKKLHEEIRLMEAALQKNSVKKEKSMGEILSLQAKIKSREKLITNINGQIDELGDIISTTESDIIKQSADLEKMKTDYAEMLRKSYSNLLLQNDMTFFLSSTTFAEALQRYEYLLRAADARRLKAKEIQQMITSLQQKKTDLEENKNEKVGLLQQQTSQKSRLESEKKEKDQAVQDLQQKDQKLKTQLAQKNKAIQQLNAKIQGIIEEEIRLAKRKAEEDAKKKKTTTTNVVVNKKTNETMPLTPAEQALSKDFSNNKGKLPWPVERGSIIAQFGRHEHAVIKGVMIENNGVDIRTSVGADAKAVFGGTVVGVFFMPTLQNCVMVKHGEFFTVYSNLETVTVSANQTISTRQVIGKLHTDKGEDITKVHLEIWRGKDKMDPEQWLAGR